MLVVLFGEVERTGLLDLGDDGSCESAGPGQGQARCDGGPVVCFVVDEDSGAVLAADVGALAVGGGRVVNTPENVEQLFVGDLLRVESDADCFCVAGSVGAD